MVRDPLRLQVAIYRILIFVYPPSHRKEYGPLMVQLFRDLSRDAFRQGGRAGLARFWLRMSFDLLLSACAAHLEAVGEVLMAVNPTLKPVPWGQVLLVVVPGLLLAYARIYPPLASAALISFALVVFLALAWLALQKRLPAWGLLGLGLLVGWVLLLIVGQVQNELGIRLRLDYNQLQLLVSAPVWILILLLAWRYTPGRAIPAWGWLVLLLVVAGFTAYLGPGVLSSVGFILLPAALGLPLARQHGPLASLFVIGAYSPWLFDADYYSVPLMKDMAFYPFYVLLLWVFMIGLAPLLLLRARSRLDRAVGLLAPVFLALGAAVAVPWLMDPGFHPLRIWLGTAGLMAFTLLVLALGFFLYQGWEAGADQAELKREKSPL
jgi:hypothetical protein